MAEIRHLPRAPITEAVIDLQVEAPATVTVEALVRALAEHGNLGYTNKGSIVRGEFGFSLLERFLKLLPAIPEGVPEALSGFLQRFVLYDAAAEATVILTQALEEPSPERPLPVILDIDAFRVTALSPGEPAVWRCLEQLRHLKNRVFFGCLTEPAIELYL